MSGIPKVHSGHHCWFRCGALEAHEDIERMFREQNKAEMMRQQMKNDRALKEHSKMVKEELLTLNKESLEQRLKEKEDRIRALREANTVRLRAMNALKIHKTRSNAPKTLKKECLQIPVRESHPFRNEGSNEKESVLNQRKKPNQHHQTMKLGNSGNQKKEKKEKNKKNKKKDHIPPTSSPQVPPIHHRPDYRHSVGVARKE